MRLQQVGVGALYRLEIPSCCLEDAGAYSIVAKNEYGEARAVVSLQVYAKGEFRKVSKHRRLKEQRAKGILKVVSLS